MKGEITTPTGEKSRYSTCASSICKALPQTSTTVFAKIFCEKENSLITGLNTWAVTSGGIVGVAMKAAATAMAPIPEIAGAA
jgi:hypothetical protein